MKTTMSLNRIRIAPRKMRMVIDLVRGKKVAQAKDILRFRTNRGARILLKFLEAAVASAKTLGQGDELNLSIFKIAVDEGSKLKRWRPRAKGSAYPIQKKVSSITLVLEEVKGEKLAQTSRKESKEAESKPGAISNARQGRLAKSPAKAKQFALAPRGAEQSAPRPKSEKGIQRFFRRKVI